MVVRDTFSSHDRVPPFGHFWSFVLSGYECVMRMSSTFNFVLHYLHFHVTYPSLPTCPMSYPLYQWSQHKERGLWNSTQKELVLHLALPYFHLKVSIVGWPTLEQFVWRDRPGEGSVQKNSCCDWRFGAEVIFILGRWIPLRLSKRQLPATVLFRTTLTRTITVYELLIPLGSNHLLY